MAVDLSSTGELAPAEPETRRPAVRVQPVPDINPWAIALTVMLATFMEVLDTSVANVALPHIAGSLSATIDESTWVLTSYLVSNAIVLPLAGWFSSLFGRKRFYMACVVVFTVSSLLCGLAPNLWMLILFRILQGVGGGAMQPISQAILVESFPKKKQGMAMAVYGMGVVLAPIIGPTLGGWITDDYSWRWIFLINIPGRPALPGAHRPANLRPALPGAQEPGRRPAHRLHRPGPDRHRPGFSGSPAG